MNRAGWVGTAVSNHRLIFVPVCWKCRRQSRQDALSLSLDARHNVEMDNDSALAPKVLYLNVEEVIDGAWSADRSLLPSLFGKGDSPIPEGGSFQDVYRRVYEDFVDRFTKTVNRLAQEEVPGQVVIVEAGDVLCPWHKGHPSSLGDPLFEKALAMTPLPTREDIESA
ncbi:hypothetical protein [Auritidibacter ignavus]|uniref:hypothetical protein n=1 Tax=Auritidibacter ignavus TaxID=678932 RepID=UPI0011B235BF|nr:hypothetical protein [Auritidibacter ignavus]WHS29081.1 hypothetical protein QM395_04995 [Auritidibacter ignavus]